MEDLEKTEDTANYTIEDGVLTFFDEYSIADELIIPDGVKKINGDAIVSSLLKARSVIIPEGVEEIGEAAFLDCESIEHVVLPSTLKYI